MKKLCSVLVFFVLLSSSYLMADFVNVPAAAFQSVEDSGIRVSSRHAYIALGSTEQTLYAPVYLPDGAIIKNIRVQYMDNDAANDMTVELVQANTYLGTFSILLTETSSGASASVQSMVDSDCSPNAPSKRLVINSVLTWCIRVAVSAAGPGDTLRIYGVVIEY